MDVVYASNDAYAPFLGISMLSLFENNKELKSIRVFILGEEIQADNVQKLDFIARSYKRELIFIDATSYKDKIQFDFDASGYNPITLARLFLCSYLPDDVERVLYLDCDTAVNGSLGELESIDFKGALCAAVPELNMPHKNKAQIGHKKEDCYYNAGILLCNVSAWRAESAEKRFIDYFASVGGHLLYNDQDIINHCCKDRILALPLKYNVSGNHFYFHRFMVKRLQSAYDVSDSDEYKKTILSPLIIHFLGDERPWIRGNRNFYRDIFRKYKAMTPYSDMKEIGGQRLYMLCYHILNLITFVCPWFRVVFSKFIGINKYQWAGKA